MSVRSHGSSYGDSGSEADFNPDEDLWQPKKTLVVANPDPPVVELRSERRESVSTQNTTSTLALDDAGNEVDLKTPRVVERVRTQLAGAAASGAHEDAVAGPMETLLLSLLQKVSVMEQNQPTVMSADYAALQRRVSDLEAARRSRDEEYQNLLLLRNGDLENLIMVRDTLAHERREHAATRQLRQDDLSNVYSLRDKLANTTWALAKTQETMKFPSPVPARQSLNTSSDLWQAAKTAALEQRVLELEKANRELREQAARAGGSGATVDVVARVEKTLEDSLRYREKMGAKMQQLRSERDVLQRDLAALEDRNGELEGLVERLQRRV